jgi:hypothetical protein
MKRAEGVSEGVRSVSSFPKHEREQQQGTGMVGACSGAWRPCWQSIEHLLGDKVGKRGLILGLPRIELDYGP